MRILLDTHIFLWSVRNDRRLTKSTRALISTAEDVYVSSASVWEASIKIKLGKLDVDIDEFVDAIAESGFSELAITTKHAAEVGKLPDFHRDPFDRILIAQALSEPLKLITSDKLMKKYSSELVQLV